MGKLINDSVLLENLGECSIVSLNLSGDGKEWEDYVKLDTVIELIKAQPEAYKVDAVIEQLIKECDANAGGLYKEQILVIVKAGEVT